MSYQPTIIGTDVQDRPHAVDLVKLVIDGKLPPYNDNHPPRGYVPQPGDVWIYCQSDHKAARWVDGYAWTPSSTSAPSSSNNSYSTCKQAIRRFSKMPRATAMKKLDAATRHRVADGTLLLEYFSEKGSILYDANTHLVRKRLKWRIGRKTWILVAYGRPNPKPIYVKKKTKPARRRSKRPSRQHCDDDFLDALKLDEAQDSDLDLPFDVTSNEMATNDEEMSNKEHSAHDYETTQNLHDAYDDEDCPSDVDLLHSGASSPISVTYLPTPPSSNPDASTQTNLYEFYPETSSTNSTTSWTPSSPLTSDSDNDTLDHAWMGRIQAEQWLVWLEKNDAARYEHLLAMVPYLA